MELRTKRIAVITGIVFAVALVVFAGFKTCSHIVEQRTEPEPSETQQQTNISYKDRVDPANVIACDFVSPENILNSGSAAITAESFEYIKQNFCAYLTGLGFTEDQTVNCSANVEDFDKYAMFYFEVVSTGKTYKGVYYAETNVVEFTLYVPEPEQTPEPVIEETVEPEDEAAEDDGVKFYLLSDKATLSTVMPAACAEVLYDQFNAWCESKGYILSNLVSGANIAVSNGSCSLSLTAIAGIEGGSIDHTIKADWNGSEFVFQEIA